jgi:adenosylhomocysteinase
MKDGAIVANSGHFDVEIDIAALKKLSKSQRRIRSFVDGYTLRSGKKIYVLGEGRLVNLAAAEGHPASVMDLSFANQSLSVEYVASHHGELKNKVYAVPEEIDRSIAQLKLQAMKISIDTLTRGQRDYLKSWQFGT